MIPTVQIFEHRVLLTLVQRFHRSQVLNKLKGHREQSRIHSKGYEMRNIKEPIGIIILVYGLEYRTSAIKW